jgi:formate dehydrogenase major subunit
VPGLGTTVGRGGATTALTSLADSDAIMIMGSSMAEQHPVGFQWVIEARERGGKVIHVDPRFTRTSASADIWAPLRAGTDILFLGGLIHYAIEHDKWFKDYVLTYTNASTILREDFRDTEDLDGLFSGWDAEKRQYSPDTWLYEGSEQKRHPSQPAPGHHPADGGHGKDRGGEAGNTHQYTTDPTLQHPRCVFQVLKRHFSRYTPEMVEQGCGMPKEVFLEVAETFTSASGTDKTACICYAVGWTHHSTGVQIIRCAAILQLLLGNMGRPGGGILALRGHASIQGSTDIPTLYDILPGYLAMPFFEDDSKSLSKYIEKHSDKAGVWANFDAYIVSLLKAWYGDAATAENEWGFQWMPRVTGDHSELGYWLDMADGKMEGLFVMGQNPAVGAPNGRLQRSAMKNLKWLVVRDMIETETASFWLDSPEVKRGELVPEKIATEVFLMPAAGQAEKNGSFTNTQRLVQWHNKAVDPPGDSRSETWFMYHLGRRIKGKAAKAPGPKNIAINNLTWSYPTEGAIAEPVAEAILAEINGCQWDSKTHIETYDELKPDGSTACGCWIYAGLMPSPDKNLPNTRESHDSLGHGWGFAWPKDTRIIYNRASAKPDGTPWSERKKLIWWDPEAGEKGKWVGRDNSDFKIDMPPDHKGDSSKRGLEALDGDQPFTLHPDGRGWLFVTSGLKDGPLPTHFEPLESLVQNPVYPSEQTNPPAHKKERPDNPYAHSPDDPRFPYVLTTYRLTEHHTAGGMSRGLSHLAELQPELFTEISPELAEICGVKHGEWVTIYSPRGLLSAKALVTGRMAPLKVNGKMVHQVGLPYHFGWKGIVTGDVVNDLLAISESPNVRIMESKALVCNLIPGRRAQGPAALKELKRLLKERA